MFKKVIVKADERGLLFKKGSYVKHLQPGAHRLAPFSDDEIVLLNVTKPFVVQGKDLNLFLQDERLLEEITVINVQDHEYVLHYEDGKFVSLLIAGKYAFWNALKKHDFTRVDIRQPEVGADIDRAIFAKVAGYLYVSEVASHETGCFFITMSCRRSLPQENITSGRGQ